MKQRLRRKRKVKEFAEYGCEIEAEWSFDIPDTTDHSNDNDPISQRIFKAWDDLLFFVSLRNLGSGGSSNSKSLVVIIEKCNRSPSRKYNVSPTKQDRDAVVSYLLNSPDFKKVKQGVWTDLWYPEKTHNYTG